MNAIVSTLSQPARKSYRPEQSPKLLFVVNTTKTTTTLWELLGLATSARSSGSMLEWIAPEVEKIAKWSVEQARKIIRECGDQDHWR